MSYSTPHLTDQENYSHAFDLLEHLDGLTVAQCKSVFATAEQLLDQLNNHQCNSREFKKAKAAFTHLG